MKGVGSIVLITAVTPAVGALRGLSDVPFPSNRQSTASAYGAHSASGMSQSEKGGNTR